VPKLTIFRVRILDGRSSIISSSRSLSGVARQMVWEGRRCVRRAAEADQRPGPKLNGRARRGGVAPLVRLITREL
jgi:hypothetical protein